VLMGDIDNAIHLHQIFIELWKKYHAIPELYNFRHNSVVATKDPYYLDIGEMILNDIEKFCRTKCGFAQLKPLTGLKKEDRMESFFIIESLKYLYLLFDEDNYINNNYSNSIFTTGNTFIYIIQIYKVCSNYILIFLMFVINIILEGHFLLLPHSVYNRKSYENSSFLNANPHTNITCPFNTYNIVNPLLSKNEKIKIFNLVNGIKKENIMNDDLCLL
ncbi:seven-hairpin glycosidase, partial [Piromyces finnis]